MAGEIKYRPIAFWRKIGVKGIVNAGSSPNTLLLFTILSFFFLSCQGPPQVKKRSASLGDVSPCAQIETNIEMHDRIETLRAITQAFNDKCYETVIAYGTKAQNEYRHKIFSVTKEMGNLLLPDGTVVDYVMESYERGYLSQLLAASYFHLDKTDASKVELRRLDHEIFTPLYNYGPDPINIVFSAVLWEMLGEREDARVDWSRLQRHEDLDEQIRVFSTARLNRMNREVDNVSGWNIYAIGKFPQPDWSVHFKSSHSSYYSVVPKQKFLPTCFSDTGIRISTESWFQKIAMRHTHSYHPLLNIQSWLRLPVGVAYGVTTFAAGATVAMGGCFVDVYGRGNGKLCLASLEGGIALMLQSPKVLRHMLRPDLRHWDSVPSSFLFTTASDVEDEPCFASLPEQDHQLNYPIL